MFNRRLLQLSLNQRFTLAATVLLGFAGGILVVLQARLLSSTVAQVFLDQAALADVAGLLRWLLLVILLRSGLTWAAEISANHTAVQIKHRLRQELFAHIQQLGPQYVRGESTGELTNTCVEGIEALDAYFREYVPQLALAAFVPLTILLLVFPLDWISGVILLLTAPLIPFFMLLIGSLAEALTRRQWQTLSRMSAYFLDILQGITTLKIFGRSRAQIAVISQISEQFRTSTMQVLRVAFLSALVLELLSTLSIALIAVGIGVRLLYGQLVFVDAFFILVAAPDFYLPLRLLGSRFHAGIAGVSAAERIFAILDIPLNPGLAEKPDQPAPTTMGHSRVEVELNNVTFTYPGEITPALQSVSLHIPPGARVALVGPSGAGKSTLAALLLGLMEPDTGQILVRGLPVGGQTSAERRAACAWVPQRPYLFNDNVAANLRLAHPHASQQDLQQAAAQARADGFIRQLPHGYQTQLGERGSRLSSGQAQRLALARAFLKDAPLLVLDEATANLDPQLENEVQAGFAMLQQQRTVLLIAHRLPTVRTADRIYVLDQGRIVQSGSHGELLDQPGLYRDLVRAYADNDSVPPRLEIQPLQPEPRPALSADVPAGAALTEPVRQPVGTRKLVALLAGFLRPYLAWVLLSVLLGFATIASGIGLMAASAYIIASAALQPSIAELQVAIVGVRFFGLARGMFRYLERLVSHHTTFQVLARLRSWFYAALEPLAPARLQQYRSGDLLGRIVADINTLENFYIRGLAPPLVALLVSAIMAVFMSAFHPLLAAVLLLFLALAGIALPLLARLLSRRPGAALVRLRAALNEHIVDGLQGLPDLLIYQRVAAYQQHLAALGHQFNRAQNTYSHLQALQNSLMLLLSNTAMWLLLLLGIGMVRAGQFDGVSLAVIVLAALACFEAVQGLPQAASSLQSSLQAAGRLYEIVDTPPPVPQLALSPEFPADRRPLTNKLPPRLRAVDLSFSYPGAHKKALAGVNFDLPAGGRLALVGPSGAGKSTLVSLLLRFWDLPPGSLLLDGIDLRTLAPDQLRAAIAVVSQNTYIFNASVRDNLRIARPRATDTEIEAACRLAQIQDTIVGLPQGMDSMLGEHGQRLSGGERQRLAIARAVLKDAPLLILDEATSGLDSLTEQDIWQSLSGIMEGRTTLVITHRLTGLQAMGEILVLREGRVVEHGTHAQLSQNAGLYASMLALQNQILPEKLPARPV